MPGAASCGSSGTIEIGNSCTPSATTLCLDGAPGDQRFRVRTRFAGSQAGIAGVLAVFVRWGFALHLHPSLRVIA